MDDPPRRPRRLPGATLALMLASAAVTGIAAFQVFGPATNSTATAVADLSVRQHIGASATPGQLAERITIHNAGPSIASHVTLDVIVRSETHRFTLSTDVTGCRAAEPPADAAGELSCHFDALADGADVTIPVTWHGDAGIAFTATANVTDSGPDDPVMHNNSAAVQSWFGGQADLSIRGTAAPGSTPGTAVLTADVVNNGPSVAATPAVLIELSAGTSVGYVGTPVTTCQYASPSSGYAAAVVCTSGAAVVGGRWSFAVTVYGDTATNLSTVTTVSTSPAALIGSGAASSVGDPVSGDNALPASTRFG